MTAHQPPSILMSGYAGLVLYTLCMPDKLNFQFSLHLTCGETGNTVICGGASALRSFAMRCRNSGGETANELKPEIWICSVWMHLHTDSIRSPL